MYHRQYLYDKLNKLLQMLHSLIHNYNGLITLKFFHILYFRYIIMYIYKHKIYIFNNLNILNTFFLFKYVFYLCIGNK